MTLAGARRFMKKDGNIEIAQTNGEVIDRLRAIRKELVDIRTALEFL